MCKMPFNLANPYRVTVHVTVGVGVTKLAAISQIFVYAMAKTGLFLQWKCCGCDTLWNRVH